jgi:hypothetical protein
VLRFSKACQQRIELVEVAAENLALLGFMFSAFEFPLRLRTVEFLSRPSDLQHRRRGAGYEVYLHMLGGLVGPIPNAQNLFVHDLEEPGSVGLVVI